MWVNFPVTDAHQCCPGVVLILFYCRWSEVTRRLELWIQILEINENGDFVPVEVIPARDVRTGGIFQLRQVGISPNTFTVNWVTATNLIFKKPAFEYFHYFQTNILSSKHVLLHLLINRASREESRWKCGQFRTRAPCLL